jgi:hypothetical protein
MCAFAQLVTSACTPHTNWRQEGDDGRANAESKAYDAIANGRARSCVGSPHPPAHHPHTRGVAHTEKGEQEGYQGSTNAHSNTPTRT